MTEQLASHLNSQLLISRIHTDDVIPRLAERQEGKEVRCDGTLLFRSSPRGGRSASWFNNDERGEIEEI